MVDEPPSSPLSDRDYQELIAHRVRDALRQERQSVRRWRLGIGITLLAALLGLLGVQYRNFDSRFEGFEPVVQGYAQRPFVDGLETEFSQANRLVITGTAFGSERGGVELFYKRSISDSLAGDADVTGETRSATITLQNERIEQWTKTQIIVTTTPEQRAVLLESIGADGFEGLIPYIRIATADGRRSPVW